MSDPIKEAYKSIRGEEGKTKTGNPEKRKFRVKLWLVKPYDVTEICAEITDGLESKGIEVEFCEAR